MKRCIAIFLIFLTSLSTSVASGCELSDIKFFGFYKGEKGVDYFVDEKKISIEEGKTVRLQFSEFNEVEGVNTDVIDIEAELRNCKSDFSKNHVMLLIYSQKASLTYIQEYPEKILDIDKMRQMAEWSEKPIISLTKENIINSISQSKIIFRNINLKEIILKLEAKNEWPVSLKFILKIEDNEVISRILKMPLPAY